MDKQQREAAVNLVNEIQASLIGEFRIAPSPSQVGELIKAVLALAADCEGWEQENKRLKAREISLLHAIVQGSLEGKP